MHGNHALPGTRVTPEVLAALHRVVDELGAGAGVLLRITPSGACVVTSSTLGSALGVDDVWGRPGEVGGTGLGPELVTEPERLAELVPAGVLRALTVAPTAAMVAPLGDGTLRIIVLWTGAAAPVDPTRAVQSEAMQRFMALAPLFDAQVRAHEGAMRLRAVAAALDQAIVVTVAGDVRADINAAAALLLGLQPGPVDGEHLSDAMRALCERAVDPEGLAAEVSRLRRSPTAVARGWVWHLHGSPSHLRVTSVPVETAPEGGRVWVFDDISAEVELVENEQRVNRALAASKESYRLLAENVSDVVIMGSPDGTFTWVSPSVTATLGWAPEDLVGRNAPEFVRPDHLEVLEGAMEQVRRGGHQKFMAPIRTAGGSHRWMQMRGGLLLDGGGTVIGWVAALWDVHESHEAKDQLAQSERRYRLLLENTTEVVFQTVDGVVTWVSPAVEEVTGWTPAHIVGTSSRQLWHPDDWERASWAHDDARDGVAAREVLRLVRPDGSHQWMEVVIRPYVEPDGRLGTVGMTYDVSDREGARAAARESEERYRMVAEHANDIVCSYTPDGTIEWIFGSTEVFLGRTAEELVGTRLVDYFVAEDWGDRDVIRMRLGRGEAVQLLARLRHVEQGTRWVHVRAQAVLGPDGSLVSIIGTMRDAQAEVEYREALFASERQARDLLDAYEAARDDAVRASSAKTAFLSRMSHELRTPLNAVLGFAQLLALDPLTPDQDEAVQHIRTGGRHLLDLINEIVDISRIEAGRLSLGMETVDSAAVLAESVELVGPLARQFEVAVAVADTDPAVSDVHADRQRTIQVLLNLMSNAVKYNRPGGSVRVDCRTGAPGEVAFEVSDTGPGIPEELLPRLFEPFDRLGAENSDVEGTGIGLALADALARAMGGRIEVTTEVGSGSTFVLVLRAAHAESTQSRDDGPARDAHPDSRLHVLYIEDNPTNATLMARVVALRPGSRLEVAVDGSQGIAAALHEPPDLVFLDVHLPDLPGEEVLRRLRRLPGCADVPVVVVTADASPSLQRRMVDLGCDGFLTKPLDLDDVLGWIDATATGLGMS